MRLRPAFASLVLALSTTAIAHAETPRAAAELASWKTLDNARSLSQPPSAPTPAAAPIADTGVSSPDPQVVPQRGDIALSLETGMLVPSGYSYGTVKLSDELERMTLSGVDVNFRSGHRGVPVHLDLGVGDQASALRVAADWLSLSTSASTFGASVGARRVDSVDGVEVSGTAETHGACRLGCFAAARRSTHPLPLIPLRRRTLPAPRRAA